MDRAALQARQGPLRAHYRDDPSAALVTLRAHAALDPDDVACSVETWHAVARAGLHPAGGGDESLACSGEMLLQALVACAGVTLRSVATNRGISVTGDIHAEGDLDFRGIIGVARDAPVGFTAIRLRFDIESDATPEELDRVLLATERYCTVYQTLVRSPALSTTRG